MGLKTLVVVAPANLAWALLMPDYVTIPFQFMKDVDQNLLNNHFSNILARYCNQLLTLAPEAWRELLKARVAPSIETSVQDCRRYLQERTTEPLPAIIEELARDVTLGFKHTAKKGNASLEADVETLH